MTKCFDCPRACGADRDGDARGFCGVTGKFKVSRIAPHYWEEPPISGKRGSGTVFFSGCNLRCVFCQNKSISHGGVGEVLTDGELEKRILTLIEKDNVHNINFVTPTHYTRRLASLLERLRPQIKVPIVWNTSAYESTDTLSMLDGIVDIYLPDFKYHSPELAKKYSSAEDYPSVAANALKVMYSQVGKVTFDSDGMMTRGMIVRHLVLPSCRKDSIALLRRLSELLPIEDIRLSLMSQYTPDFVDEGCPYTELFRKVTTFEYNSVLSEAQSIGFVGYFQDKSSATAEYTPKFE